MAITPGIDTWATVDEADTYLGKRVDAEAWFLLPDDGVIGGASKENYLTTAYDWIGGMYSIGASASAPEPLKKAQILAANWLIAYSRDYSAHQAISANGVDEFQWSRWNEKLSGVKLPRSISDLLLPLGYGGTNQFVQLYGDDYQR